MRITILMILGLVLGAPLALAFASPDGSGSASVAALPSGSGSAEPALAGSGSGSAVDVAALTPTEVPDLSQDPGGFFGAAYQAATSKQWLLLTGFVLMTMVWIARYLLAKQWKWFATTIGGIVAAFAISAGGTIGAAILASRPITAALLLSAATTAATAAGLWQWVSKQFPALKLDKPST